MDHKEYLKKQEEHLTNEMPEFFQDFLNDVYNARFMKKKRDSTNEYTPDIALWNKETEKEYLGLDWQILNINRHDYYDLSAQFMNKLIFRFGIIPHYMNDGLTSIQLDMEKREATIVRGYAYGPYASRVVSKAVRVPKYFQGRVARFWEEYEAWYKENYVNMNSEDYKKDVYVCPHCDSILKLKVSFSDKSDWHFTCPTERGCPGHRVTQKHILEGSVKKKGILWKLLRRL